MSREDQYSVSATLNGVNLGVFDKMDGGDVDSDEVKYKPGGLAGELTLGGTVSVSNITLSRLFVLERDLPLVPVLNAAAGSGDMVISKQSLDVDKNAFGAPTVYSGKLKTVKLPAHDSNSNSAAMIELEISAAGTPA